MPFWKFPLGHLSWWACLETWNVKGYSFSLANLGDAPVRGKSCNTASSTFPVDIDCFLGASEGANINFPKLGFDT